MAQGGSCSIEEFAARHLNDPWSSVRCTMGCAAGASTATEVAFGSRGAFATTLAARPVYPR